MLKLCLALVLLKCPCRPVLRITQCLGRKTARYQQHSRYASSYSHNARTVALLWLFAICLQSICKPVCITECEFRVAGPELYMHALMFHSPTEAQEQTFDAGHAHLHAPNSVTPPPCSRAALLNTADDTRQTQVPSLVCKDSDWYSTQVSTHMCLVTTAIRNRCPGVAPSGDRCLGCDRCPGFDRCPGWNFICKFFPPFLVTDFW